MEYGDFHRCAGMKNACCEKLLRKLINIAGFCRKGTSVLGPSAVISLRVKHLRKVVEKGSVSALYRRLFVAIGFFMCSEENGYLSPRLSSLRLTRDLYDNESKNNL